MKKNHLTIGVVYLLHLLFSVCYCAAEMWFVEPFFFVYFATFPIATAVAAVLDMVLCLIFRKGWKFSLATGALGVIQLWFYREPNVLGELRSYCVYIVFACCLAILICWLIRWLRIKKAATQ